MPKISQEPLFELIKSLSKSEKRNFKVYANRINPNEEAKFVQLFDIIDQLKEYTEDAILQRGKGIKSGQLSNLKAHLYKQILTSLRLNHINQNADIQIRENIDYARILYNKGLYRQSLKVLDKVKQKAVEEKQHVLHLEILDFEKMIESQYITRSIGDRAEELTSESVEVGATITRTQELSNLALSLYGLYLKVGFVRNKNDFQLVKTYFDGKLPNLAIGNMSFFEKLYYFQSKGWYYYIIQDFPQCYRNAQYWVDLFHNQPEMIPRQMDLYIKGLHNLQLALFNTRSYLKHNQVLEDLMSLSKSTDYNFTENNRVLLFLYTNLAWIDKHFLEGTFSIGLTFLPEFNKELKRLSGKLDYHWLLLFYYKIACLYFGSGDNKNAITYLNKIINFKDQNLREDLHCFARILNLIAHFEIGNEDLVDYQVKSVYRFLAKMDNLQSMQLEIFKFLRKLPKVMPSEIKKEFEKLKNKLIQISQDPMERRPFLYLDIISWLESKIEGRPVQDVINDKFRDR
ncbi:MAG: hypothetical protein RJQ09_00410 [Cyclobacteriaceae bacterium]